MALSAVHEKTRQPTDEDLRSVLGNTYPVWNKLLALVADQIEPITGIWKFTSATTGWGMRVLHKERVILYMTPQPNQFLVSFALGERAVAVARTVRLPASLLQAIADAPRYAEGRGVRIPVRNSRQLTALVRLARIKSES